MTAPLSRLGACCASGDVRRDPWTGDERCLHCGVPVPLPNVAGAALHGEESPPPVVEGGQGRDASDLEDDARGILWVLVALAVVMAVGAWAAAG